MRLRLKRKGFVASDGSELEVEVEAGLGEDVETIVGPAVMWLYMLSWDHDCEFCDVGVEI